MHHPIFTININQSIAGHHLPIHDHYHYNNHGFARQSTAGQRYPQGRSAAAKCHQLPQGIQNAISSSFPVVHGGCKGYGVPEIGIATWLMIVNVISTRDNDLQKIRNIDEDSAS